VREQRQQMAGKSVQSSTWLQGSCPTVGLFFKPLCLSPLVAKLARSARQGETPACILRPAPPPPPPNRRRGDGVSPRAPSILSFQVGRRVFALNLSATPLP